DLGPLGVGNAPDGEKPLRQPIPLEHTARVHQPDAVDEVQPHPAPFDYDLADRPLDPATDLGAVVGQAAPQQRLFSVWHGATNHVRQRTAELPRLGCQGIQNRLQVGLHHETSPSLCRPGATAQGLSRWRTSSHTPSPLTVSTRLGRPPRPATARPAKLVDYRP